jgi:sugar lactone lactonase YvrE
MPRSFAFLLLVVLLSSCAVGAPNAAPQPVASPEPATTAPTEPPPTPTLPALSQTTTDADGFVLRLPAGWQTRVGAGGLTAAPNAAGLDVTSPGDALVMTIDATPLALLTAQYGSGAVESAETFFEVSSAAAQQAGYQISPTRPILVDGQPGLQADLTAPGGAGRLVVVLAPDRAVRILGQAAPEAWARERALFDAIVAALSLPLPVATPTPAAVQAEQPVLLDRGPPGFVLRLGGSSGPNTSRFTAARGMAVAPDGTLYLAESSRGVWVFAPDGTLIRTFGADELLDAYDIARGPNGEIFVADYGRNTIARFRPDGFFVGRWGSPGAGDDQFGLSAPQRIAAGADGSIYALDVRSGAAGVVSSIVRFGPTGELIGRLELPPELAPADLAVDAAGAIYLAETFAGAVVKLGPDGRELARFGDPADPERLAAGALDVDRQGNIYVATFGSGVILLGPDGREQAQGGIPADAGATPAAGAFSLPNGIAAGPGGIVWVSDNSGEYSALTALRLVAEPVVQATAEVDAAVVGTPTPDERLLRQWANAAVASSSYEPDYGPDGATGPPDIEGCQDSPDAWASADPNGLETLELRYRTPVFAVGVTIYQNHQPGFISRVELIDERGSARSVYTAEPALSSECPLVINLRFEQTLNRIVAVRLTVDQRNGANWSEVDAVELVGLP